MGQFIDLTGRVFGRLVVVGRDPSIGSKVRWRVRCSCAAGTEKLVDGGHLRSGLTESCGCLRLEKLREKCVKGITVGTVFGRLTVVRIGPPAKNGKSQVYVCCACSPQREFLLLNASLFTGATCSCGCLRNERTRERRASILTPGTVFGNLTVRHRALHPKGKTGVYWLCDCVCGRDTIVSTNLLRCGNTKSCGCRIGAIHDTAAKDRLLRDYQSGAKTRGLLWSLSADEFFELTLGNCHYCGAPPGNTKVVPPRKNGLLIGAHYTHNGIDRVNSSLGYQASNCVSCCGICNLAKMDMPYDKFIAWIHRVGTHQGCRSAL